LPRDGIDRLIDGLIVAWCQVANVSCIFSTRTRSTTPRKAHKLKWNGIQCNRDNDCLWKGMENRMGGNRSHNYDRHWVHVHPAIVIMTTHISCELRNLQKYNGIKIFVGYPSEASKNNIYHLIKHQCTYSSSTHDISFNTKLNENIEWLVSCMMLSSTSYNLSCWNVISLSGRKIIIIKMFNC